jgi:hypothetical protein
MYGNVILNKIRLIIIIQKIMIYDKNTNNLYSKIHLKNLIIILN